MHEFIFCMEELEKIIWSYEDCERYNYYLQTENLDKK